MMRRVLQGFFLGLILFGWTGVVQAAPVFPDPGYVVDQAQLLSSSEAADLAREIEDYRASTTHEIAMLTMPDLGGLTASDYAQQLWDKWKIGFAGRDNGVLLLVAVAENRIRIQTGRGVEDVLTDIQASHIISDQMRPLYDKGDRAEAIVTGVHAIMDALTVAPPAPVTIEPVVAQDHWWDIFTDPGFLIVFGMFAFWIIVIVIVSWLDRRAGRKSSWDERSSSSGSSNTSGSSSSSSSSSSDWGSSSSGSSSGSSSSSGDSTFSGFGGGSSGGGGAEG